MSDSTSPTASRALTGNLFCITSMVVWAAGFPAAEALLETWDPLALVTARFCMALAVLMPVWIMLDGWRAVARARWGWGLVSGAIGFGAGSWLMLLAQSLTDPVTVAIIAASSPIAASLIEWVAERKALKLTFVLGLVASVIGGFVATGGAVPAGGSVANLGLGMVCAVASCSLFAWGSYVAVRDFTGLSAVGRTTMYELIGAGEISLVRIGRSVRVSIATLEDFVAEREDEARATVRTPSLAATPRRTPSRR